jgi:hypothetical protein
MHIKSVLEIKKILLRRSKLDYLTAGGFMKLIAILLANFLIFSCGGESRDQVLGFSSQKTLKDPLDPAIIEKISYDRSTGLLEVSQRDPFDSTNPNQSVLKLSTTKRTEIDSHLDDLDFESIDKYIDSSELAEILDGLPIGFVFQTTGGFKEVGIHTSRIDIPKSLGFFYDISTNWLTYFAEEKAISEGH